MSFLAKWPRIWKFTGLGQHMLPVEYCTILKYRLMISLFPVDAICLVCRKACLDSFGEHAVHCKELLGFKYRHNMVRDVLFDICRRDGISAKKEAPVNFLTDLSDGRSTLRPADVLVFGWVGGKHACVDLTGVSPLVGLSSRGFTAGQAALKAASGKVTKHEKACIENQHVFIPVAFDTFGFLAPEAVEPLSRVQRVMHSNGELKADAVTLLKRIWKFSMTMNIEARAAVHIFNRISFTIAKGVGTQICMTIGYGFLPFSFSSLGELEADAVTLLKRIRKFSMAQDIGARAAVHIFNMISFAIAKGINLLMQGDPLDPLAPYLFILVMESLHLSFSRVVDAGIFKGIKIDNSTMISHLFYADDAVFVGMGIHDLIVAAAASTLGCSIMKTPFKYLGVTVGEMVLGLNGEWRFSALKMFRKLSILYRFAYKWVNMDSSSCTMAADVTRLVVPMIDLCKARYKALEGCDWVDDIVASSFVRCNADGEVLFRGMVGATFRVWIPLYCCQ
ncbi:hypothetical protein Tco_1458045 [Tanacetum coccineum]